MLHLRMQSFCFILLMSLWLILRGESCSTHDGVAMSVANSESCYFISRVAMTLGQAAYFCEITLQAHIVYFEIQAEQEQLKSKMRPEVYTGPRKFWLGIVRSNRKDYWTYWKQSLGKRATYHTFSNYGAQWKAAVIDFDTSWSRVQPNETFHVICEKENNTDFLSGMSVISTESLYELRNETTPRVPLDAGEICRSRIPGNTQFLLQKITSGDLIYHWSTSAASVVTCAANCVTVSDCCAFSFVPSTGKCYGTSINDNLTTGFVSCDTLICFLIR